MRTTIIISSLVITGIVATFVACNRKVLDTLPYTDTEITYFNTEGQFQQGVNGVYAKLSDFYVYNANNFLQRLTLLQGDDLTTDGGTDPYENFSYTPTESKLTDYYKFAYQVINRSNTMFEKIMGETGVYSTPGLKEKNLGEIRFLRGLMYFNLWNYFGTAPIVSSRIVDLAKVNSPNSTGTQMLDTAIADFEFAASRLPVSWDARNLGRATSNSANGMLGKALVFKATVNKSAEDYAAAIAAFQKVQGASLTADFMDNFSYLKENNSESLFEYQAGVGLAVDNVWLSNDFNGADKSFSVFYGYFTMDPNFFGGHRYIATQKFADEFEPNDPRKTLTMNAERHIQKYVGPGLNQLSGTQVSSINNFRILRYADVLLLHAEAILNSNGNTADAIALINQVRERARNQAGGDGVNPVNRDVTTTDKNTIMQWIIHERFVELGAEESIRWFDLRRWHLNGGFGINLANVDFDTESNSTADWTEKNINLPIPSTEISTNTEITQNEGY